MENQIYRLNLNGESQDLIEFYIYRTNELDPYREIRELGIVIIADHIQYDESLNVEEIDSLIKYLNDAKEYIKNFNDKQPLKSM